MFESEGIVIIGGSIAGYNLARNLRKENYQGKITLIEEKNTLPYDRSKLSTTWMQNFNEVKPPLFKKRDFFIDKRIRVLLNTKAIQVVPEEKSIILDSKETIAYEKLVIATGSKLRKLKVEGVEASGIFYLRDHEDAVEIKEWSKNVEELLIIGAGFIGLELASSLSQAGLNITVLEYEEYPMAKKFGKELSKYLINMHQEHGVHFITGDVVESFKKDNTGKIEKIITKKGKEISAQMVVIAVGVEVNNSVNIPGLAVDEPIIVNEFGESNVKDIYAVGDIVSWPYRGENIHTSHWEHAYFQSKTVAKNIIRKQNQPYKKRPYFWTDQFDQTFEYLGRAKSWDDIIIRGSMDCKEFTLAYVDKENKALAIFFANNGDKRSEVNEFMNRAEVIDNDHFKNIKNPLNKN